MFISSHIARCKHTQYGRQELFLFSFFLLLLFKLLPKKRPHFSMTHLHFFKSLLHEFRLIYHFFIIVFFMNHQLTTYIIKKLVGMYFLLNSVPIEFSWHLLEVAKIMITWNLLHFSQQKQFLGNVSLLWPKYYIGTHYLLM